MTEAPQKPISAIATIKNFFGLKPGQSNTDFIKEMKDLSADDKADLVAQIEKHAPQCVVRS